MSHQRNRKGVYLVSITHSHELAAHPDLRAELQEMVLENDYPCLGARSVFRRARATVKVYDQLGDRSHVDSLLTDLRQFADATDPAAGFASFLAAFDHPVVNDERGFEQLLWRELQNLSDADRQPWNTTVSADPGSEDFAFSAGGTAYFIVGMHPKSSRRARRSPVPLLVFNLHEQFQDLRRSGRYLRMRDTIRRRDKLLQGSVNPMVADHGEISDARQYSGRLVEPLWRPAFSATEDTCPRSRS